MGGRWRVAAIAAVILLGASCSSGTSATPDAREDARERVERMADDPPEALLRRVRHAYDRTVMRVAVTPTDPATGNPYTFTAGRDAWRAETPASLLAVDGELCFDRGFRPVLTAAVGQSYGVVEFDRQSWSCTAADFGLNPLLTFRYGREDPRYRIENLTTDDPAAYTAEVEEVDGEPVLHLRTTGVTEDGPLDPARPAYDLWIDGDHLPVRLTTDDLTWEFEYPDGAEEQLAAPPADQRGSYGYVVGPGMGTAKACYQSGQCAEDDFIGPLTWGDGRRS